MGLQDLRAGDRYLLCTGGLSPVVDDRPHRNVLTLRAVIRRRAGQLAVLAADRASVSRLTPYRWARVLHAG